MFLEIKFLFVSLWRLWSELFSPIPYGSTFFAVIVPLLIAICIGFYLAARQKRKDMEDVFGDQSMRVELYKNVLNIH